MYILMDSIFQQFYQYIIYHNKQQKQQSKVFLQTLKTMNNNNNTNTISNRINSSSTNVYAYTSITHSKYQTPIKSPSPDQTRMNALTPTKVKYFGDSQNIKGYDIVSNYNTYNPTHSRQANISYSQAVSQSQQKNRINSEEALTHSHSQHQSSLNYTKELENQVQVLTIQNRNLLQRLKSQQRISGYESTADITAPNPPRRANSQVIEKIKQQYEQKINTLKIMIQQEIKQAMDVVEDMCDLLRSKMNLTQQRVEGLQERIHQIKLHKILKMQNALNKTGSPSKMHHSSNNSSPNKHKYMQNFGENSISDILCVSIPEEEEEESKNYTVTITKLEEQIQKLKQMITQTQTAYLSEKEYLNNIIFDKNHQIKNLSEKLEIAQRKKQTVQWKYQTSIKDELKMLQQNVKQLAKQLTKSQTDYDQLIIVLENKNIETQILNQQLIMLRDKVHDSERQRIFLQQKMRFLQGNAQILQKQLKDRTKLLNEAILSKTTLEKQRISKLTSQTNKYLTQNNVLTLTARIDKILLLEQQRELKQKQLFQAEIEEQSFANRTYI